MIHLVGDTPIPERAINPVRAEICRKAEQDTKDALAALLRRVEDLEAPAEAWCPPYDPDVATDNERAMYDYARQLHDKLEEYEDVKMLARAAGQLRRDLRL